MSAFCQSTARYDGMYVQADSTVAEGPHGTYFIPAPRRSVETLCRQQASHNGDHRDHLSVTGVTITWIEPDPDDPDVQLPLHWATATKESK